MLRAIALALRARLHGKRWLRTILFDRAATPCILKLVLNFRICINLIPAEQTDTPLVANTVEELGRSAGCLS